MLSASPTEVISKASPRLLGGLGCGFYRWRVGSGVIDIGDVVFEEEDTTEPNVGAFLVAILVEIDLVPDRVEECAARAGGDRCLAYDFAGYLYNRYRGRDGGDRGTDDHRGGG